MNAIKIDQLILALSVILLTARFLGWIFQCIGQPRVIGEMTAGSSLVVRYLQALRRSDGDHIIFGMHEIVARRRR